MELAGFFAVDAVFGIAAADFAGQLGLDALIDLSHHISDAVFGLDLAVGVSEGALGCVSQVAAVPGDAQGEGQPFRKRGCVNIHAALSF